MSDYFIIIDEVSKTLNHHEIVQFWLWYSFDVLKKTHEYGQFLIFPQKTCFFATLTSTLVNKAYLPLSDIYCGVRC